MALVEFQNVTRIYKTGDHELKALDGVDMMVARKNKKIDMVEALKGAE